MRSLAPLFVLALIAPHASAQALLKPSGQAAAPLVLKALTADSKITGPVAVTTLTLRYSNPYDNRIEADFLYQLPDGAVATGFAYWYGFEKVVARIAEKKRAAEIYKTITTRQRDPALVELVGKNKLRARIFPVEPNADLRIELVYVTALPRERDGSALFKFPLALNKEAPALATCDVTVSVAGWPQMQNNLGLLATDQTLHYAVTNFRPDKDLRVRVGGVADAFLAAPSGGKDGFFTLTSLQKTAPLPVRQAYAVHRQRLGVGWLTTGRYPHATEASDPNGPAAKLWAAQSLTSLGSGSRKTAIALSLRHGIVCAHTSWIAIPIEERKRYETEKREAALEAATERLVAAIDHHHPTQKLRQQLAKLCEGTDTTPGVRLAERFWETLTPLANQAVRGDASARQKLLRESQHIGADVNHLLKQARMPLAHEELRETVRQLDPLFAAGKEETPEAQALRATAQKLIKETHTENDSMLYRLSRDVVHKALVHVATAQLDGQPEQSSDRALLQRLARFTGAPTETFLKDTRLTLAQDRLWNAQDRLRLQVDKGDRDLSQIQEEIRKHARAHQSNPEAEVRSTTERALQNLYSRYLQALAEDATNTKTLGEQLVALERTTGIHTSPNGIKNETYYNLLMRLAALHYPPRRDHQAIARLDAGLQRVEKTLGIPQRPPLPEAVFDTTEDDHVRAQLLAERRKPRPNATRLATLARELERLTAKQKGESYAKTRVALLLTDTELDLLEQEPPSPHQLKALAAQRLRSKALHARFGDPLLTIQAPQDAQLVVARFADGSVKSLAWNSTRHCWELRFDVPPHATPGAWDIQVTIIHADGHREERFFPVTVDMQAPEAHGSLTPLADGRVRIDVVASSDTRRATAFLENTEPRELLPTGHPGAFFALLEHFPQNLRVIVTDRAHNRTEVVEFARK